MVFLFSTLLAVPGLSVAGWLLYAWSLEGEDLRPYDKPVEPFATAEPSEGLDRLNEYLIENFLKPGQLAGSTRGLDAKRERFEKAGLAREYPDAEFRDDVVKIDGVDVPGRWTLLPGYDPNRRLLYMHGGGFTVGSDVSHRPLTVQLARRTGMAVFAPNYRLMPENTREDIITDSRAAYRWILKNGPDGPAPLKTLAIAGDSAGGNLVLMLGNWARDHMDRQPEAVVALSPATDSTFSSPSIKANLESDLMLQPLVGPLTKLPRAVLLPSAKKMSGFRPAHVDVSPIFDNLSNLPPTLIQASADEILADDATRFAHKAQAAGSPVQVQMWAGGLPHVFQIFDTFIPEALAALDQIELFLADKC